MLRLTKISLLANHSLWKNLGLKDSNARETDGTIEPHEAFNEAVGVDERHHANDGAVRQAFWQRVSSGDWRNRDHVTDFVRLLADHTHAAILSDRVGHWQGVANKNKVREDMA